MLNRTSLVQKKKSGEEYNKPCSLVEQNQLNVEQNHSSVEYNKPNVEQNYPSVEQNQPEGRHPGICCREDTKRVGWIQHLEFNLSPTNWKLNTVSIRLSLTTR